MNTLRSGKEPDKIKIEVILEVRPGLNEHRIRATYESFRERLIEDYKLDRDLISITIRRTE